MSSAVHGYQDLLALTIYMLISSNKGDDVPRNGCTGDETLTTQSCFGVKVLKTMPANLVEFM